MKADLNIRPEFSRSASQNAADQRSPKNGNSRRTSFGRLAGLVLSVVVSLVAFKALEHRFLTYLTPRASEGITILIGALAAVIGGYSLVKEVAGLKAWKDGAESRLAFERNLLRAVADNIPDGIFAKDTEGRYLVANEAFARRHGFASASDLIGKSVFDLFPQDRAVAMNADDVALLRGKEAVRERERCSTDDEGRVQWTLTTKVPLLDRDGVIAGIVGLHRDITRSKQAEEQLRLSETNLTTAQRIARLGSFEQDLTGTSHLEDGPMRWSEEVYRILGWEPGEMEPSRASFLRLVHPADQEEMRQAMAGAVGRGGRYAIDYRIVRPDGAERVLQATGQVICHPRTQRPLKLVGAIQDITEQKQAEEQLRAANHSLADRLWELQQRSKEIEILSESGRWLQSADTVSEAHAAIEKAAERLLPQWSGALYAMDEAGNMLEAVTHWGENLEGDGICVPADCQALRRGRTHFFNGSGSTVRCGHVLPVDTIDSICVPLTAQGRALGVLSFRRRYVPDSSVGSVSRAPAEVEQRLASVLAEQGGLALGNIELRETLRQQSTRDSLTGLFNRRYMEETLEREICRANRNKCSFAVLLMDVDHFKAFNDTYGHQAGDAVLVALGEYLRTTSRGQDIACRYGGEEFAVVLNDTTPEGALRRAEGLREGVKQLKVKHEGQSLGNVSISVGVALYPDYGPTMRELLRFADQALYSAKHNGRDQVCVPATETLA